MVSERYAIQHGAVVLPDAIIDPGSVFTNGRKINYAGAARPTPSGSGEIDARGCYVTPGLIELHFHGAGPQSLDPPNEGRFRAIADYLIERGILQFVPTMMPSLEMIKGMARLADLPDLRPHIPGIYVEGPFVSEEKRGGIQEDYLHDVDLYELKALHRLGRGKIIMMTFAPELPEAEMLPTALRKRKIIPCIGHSTASAERAAQICRRGTFNCTHLFNAMSGLDHKNPGLAAFALNNDRVYVELNPDGTHVHPELLKLTWRAKRSDRILLISDAVVSAGERPGEYEYMGREVTATDKGVYYKKQGTLVGSRVLLNEGITRFVRYTGAPLHEAVRMASLNQATLLGASDRKGSLERNKDADVVVFSEDLRNAKYAFFEGQPIVWNGRRR